MLLAEVPLSAETSHGSGRRDANPLREDRCSQRSRALLTRALLVLALLVLLAPTPTFALMYEEPRSFSMADKALQAVERVVLAEIDPARLLAEDETAMKGEREPGPLRFAVTEETPLDLENSGTWLELDDGYLWRLWIRSPGAVSQSLGLTRFDLPEGAKLWVYDPALERVEGPYTATHRSSKGRLWTPIIEGDELVVELFLPMEADRAAVRIGQVHKGYRDFEATDFEKSGACNNDVVCPEGLPWSDQIRSVARYVISGTGLCTGQLVNNTAFDGTPYFLSANHCGVDTSNDDTLVFYWNYESPNCGDLGGGSLAQNQTGAIFRASYAPSDFLLVELSASPDPAFNVFFTGWDATGAAPASTVGIHHPSGDEKAISFNTNPVTSTALGSSLVNPAATHWRVDDWEDGTTEGGSSGSCLWDAATQRCVGQLQGGFASCTSITDDWYGKFSVSWTGGGTAATRLMDWLDPGATGVLAINGDPHITTLDGTHYDFQGAGEFVVLRDASGPEIQVRQAPIATTFNPGPNPYTGLATCVSLNSALAARVGKHRVTYQPNLNGVPDPEGLQLRVDGELVEMGTFGINLGDGASIQPTGAQGGLRITFPERYVLVVTPGWWASQGYWYLNVIVARGDNPGGVSGISPSSPQPVTGGLAGVIPEESWLPRLPDGSALGPMPASLHDRYVELYHVFGKAWRVTNKSSLFDYAPGTSTATFTMLSWPQEKPPCELPDSRPVKPLGEGDARRACAEVEDDALRAHCEFDVRVTGERGFAETYILTERTAPKPPKGEQPEQPEK